MLSRVMRMLGCTATEYFCPSEDEQESAVGHEDLAMRTWSEDPFAHRPVHCKFLQQHWNAVLV